MKLIYLVIILLLQTISSTALALEQSTAKTLQPMAEPLSNTNIAQMMMGLAVVLILVFAIAWLLRRVGGVNLTGGSGTLKIIAGMSLGSRERVVLLQVGEEQLLVGVAPGRIQTLHVLETPIKVAAKSAGPAAFANKLADALRGKNK